jgi:hypothetical protein
LVLVVQIVHRIQSFLQASHSELFLHLGLCFSFCNLIDIFLLVFFGKFGFLLFYFGRIFMGVMEVLRPVFFNDFMILGMILLDHGNNIIMELFHKMLFMGYDLVMMGTVSLSEPGKCSIFLILMAIAFTLTDMLDRDSLIKGRLYV